MAEGLLEELGILFNTLCNWHAPTTMVTAGERDAFLAALIARAQVWVSAPDHLAHALLATEGRYDSKQEQAIAILAYLEKEKV